MQTYYFKYHLCADNFQIYISSSDLSLGLQTLYPICLLHISTGDVRRLKPKMDKMKLLAFQARSVQ